MLSDPATHHTSFFENSIVPMMLLDLEKVAIIDANPAAAAFYGYPRDEMRGMDVTRIETMDPRDIHALMERQQTERVEEAKVLRHRMADGTFRDVDVRVGMMSDVPGQVAYVIIMDVTSREAAFRELDEYRQRLEALLEERTHELDDLRARIEASKK